MRLNDGSPHPAVRAHALSCHRRPGRPLSIPSDAIGCLEDAGIDGTYEAIHVTADCLASFVQSVRLGALDGFNITIPYKQAIIPLIDELSPESCRLGVANTVTREEATLTGWNTESMGFAAPPKRSASARGARRAVVFGAGGSARAVIAALLELEAQVTVVARRHPEAVTELVHEMAWRCPFSWGHVEAVTLAVRAGHSRRQHHATGHEPSRGPESNPAGTNLDPTPR